MGTPEFAVPSLRALDRSGSDIAAVYTRPDKPAGRGQKPAPPPVKLAAARLGLPVRQPLSLKGEAAAAELAGLAPDVVVVSAYGLLLPESISSIPRLGCVNVHPSLLPRYRGATPVPATILAGDDFTGVSIMLLDEGMDTGPVLSQAAVSITARDTTATLTGKLSQVAAGLLLEALVAYSRGMLRPRPQPEEQATHTGVITRADGAIDWAKPAVALWREVRAYDPWPGSHTTWQGRGLKVTSAIPLTEIPARPGEVVPVPAGPAGFAVGTGEGALGIVGIQLEGKRAVAAADFIRGKPNLLGAVLPS